MLWRQPNRLFFNLRAKTEYKGVHSFIQNLGITKKLQFLRANVNAGLFTYLSNRALEGHLPPFYFAPNPAPHTSPVVFVRPALQQQNPLGFPAKQVRGGHQTKRVRHP